MSKHVHTNSDHGVDSSVWDVAEGFLKDIGVRCNECTRALAVAAQEAIEDHLRDFEECQSEG